MGTPGRKALSRELIAETALRLTDEEGLNGLSMRKLGAELGVEAMSLYHYVDSKEDLLAAVRDGLYDKIDLPVDAEVTDWEAALRHGLSALRDVLLGHSAALELFLTLPTRSQTSLEVLSWAHTVFASQGLTHFEATAALRYSLSFVIGHAANELGTATFADEEGNVDLSDIANPEHRELVSQLMNHDEVFVAGLDLVAAGLRATYPKLP